MTKKMVSPVRGYAGSPYGKRGTGFHAGLDIPGGGVSRAVYATFAGTIVEIVRGVKHGSLKTSSSMAPGRTPNLVIVQNPDGEYQLYGHCLADSRWKKGDKIKQGDYIGKTDLSGNTTGYHLHFEIWYKNKKTRNPMIDFRYFKIAVGSTPKGINNNPWGTSKPKPAPKPKPGTKAPTQSVKNRLRGMGLSQSAAGVVDYQKAHGLYPDGHWGTVTEKYYQSVRSRQQYLTKWKAVQRNGGLVVDGYWGPKSKNAERLAKANQTSAQPYKPPAFAPKRP